MPRTARASVGGVCYHVINRGNDRSEVFHDPEDYQAFNRPKGEKELGVLRRSIARGTPFGTPAWAKRTAIRLGLESSLRPRGRPRKGKQEVEK